MSPGLVLVLTHHAGGDEGAPVGPAETSGDAGSAVEKLVGNTVMDMSDHPGVSEPSDNGSTAITGGSTGTNEFRNDHAWSLPGDGSALGRDDRRGVRVTGWPVTDDV